MKITDVTCYGVSCTDVLIRGFDMSKPFEGELRRVEQVSLGVGGDATNQAMVLSRLGVSAKLVSGMGTDNVGLFIKTIIAGAGVETDEIVYSEGNSAINVIIIDETGQRNFVNAGMAKSTDYEPDLEAMKGSKIVSLGSMLVPPFTTADRILKVVKTAKENGAIVCADVISHTEYCTLADLSVALPYIDYIFPNEDEAAILTGKSNVDEMAEVFLNYGVKNVIIKVGKAGCIVYNASGRYSFPAIGGKAIDTTGAGDNFAAGFMTGLLEGKDLAGCCEFAAATAGIAVQTIGANTGVKSRQQVLDFIRDNPVK